VGFIPEGVFVVDDPSPASEDRIRAIFANELSEYKDKLYFEADSELINEKILPILKNTTRALVLGSDWERVPTKKTDNLFLYISAPISQRLIISKTYVGYKGGLALLEDIYNNLFEAGEVTGATYQARINH